MRQRIESILVLLVFCLIVSAKAVNAEPITLTDGVTRAIKGVVTDQQGAVVPGAYITAKDVKTAQVFRTRSGDDGRFAIPGLECGDYEVRVTAPGFANSLMRIMLTPDTAEAPHAAELQATMGAVQITITMHPDGESVLTCIVCEYTYFSLPFRSLPLFDRDPQKLVTLQAGVTEHLGSFSISGTRPTNKTPLLDGFDNRNSATGSFVPSISLDTVSEFNSEYYADNSVDSSYGQKRMPQLSAATRSGTNHVHADAYWYGGRTGLNANGFFANRGGLSSNLALYDQASGAT